MVAESLHARKLLMRYHRHAFKTSIPQVTNFPPKYPAVTGFVKTVTAFLKNMIETTTPISTFNRRALISFGISILAIISLCAGFAPIPFTAIVCYPASILLGIVGFVMGISSVRQIRINQEDGKTFAWISIWAGGFVILMTICFITLGILFWPYISEFFQQIWQQMHT